MPTVTTHPVVPVPWPLASAGPSLPVACLPWAALRLDWLNPDITRYIIQLNQSPERNTLSRDLQQRIIFNGDDLDAALLERLRSARWIMLRVTRTPGRQWFQALHAYLKQDTYPLQNIGIAKGDWSRNVANDGQRDIICEGPPGSFRHFVETCIKEYASGCVWSQ